MAYKIAENIAEPIPLDFIQLEFAQDRMRERAIYTITLPAWNPYSNGFQELSTVVKHRVEIITANYYTQ